MPAISVTELSMTYRVPVREPGVRAALASIVRRRYRAIEAVRSVTFAVSAGEVVGFIGPNGAGKTTTLKMLSGILHPSGGEALVLGAVPCRRERAYLRQIAMIRGSRPLGVPFELTVLDALRFQQLIYEVPDDQFNRNLAELTDLLALGPLLHRQVRALSLGERMRSGLAWSLVYRPKVLFLDEPTTGLDVAASAMIRRFVADYSRETGATILLTSHSTADVEALCPRIILLDQGRILWDGALADLAARLAPYKLVTVASVGGCRADWERYGDVEWREGDAVRLRVPRDRVPEVTARLLTDVSVDDLTVEEPPLESLIAGVYAAGVAA